MLVQRFDIDRIAVLVLNHPPANGYSHAMHKELDAHVVDIRMDDGIDVIVIRGEGEAFFCAGADIGYLRSLTPEQKYSFCLHANETLLRLENTPKLVIAALNGHCVGGGLEIALACDLRIGRTGTAKPDRIGLPEVSLGVLPGTGGTQRLTRLLGRAKALEMMIEGRNLAMHEAVALGLVHQATPAEGWWPRVLDYARTFCRPHKSAAAVGLIKRAVLGGADLPLESGLALERELQQRLFAGPDAREGLAAFLEKRPPVFDGAPRPSAPSAPSAPTPAAQAARPDSAASLPPPPAHVAPTEPRPSASEFLARRELTGRELAGHETQVARIAPSAPSAENAPSSQRPSTPRTSGGRPTEEGFFEGAFDSPTGRSRSTAASLDVERALGNVKDAVLNLVPRTLVEEWMLVPVRRDGDVLTVAMADPSKTGGIKAVEEETGLSVKVVGTTQAEIVSAITRYYRA